MYVRITSKCNMRCDHCAYSCTQAGVNMTMRTWRAARSLVGYYSDESISLGGGEPTLHPQFWQILGESIASFEYVWLATNGSVTPIALALAGMARKGVISVALSLDSYHDAIDDRVVQAFKSYRNTSYVGDNNDCREIRNVDGKEINAGRCDFGKDDGCVCPGVLIEPDGTIRACGCADAPKFGTVFKPAIPEDWRTGDCHKEQSDE